jgi:hypothetical protein
LCSICIGTRQPFVQTSLRIMIGTTVCMHTSLLTSGVAPTSTITCQISARTTTKTLARDAMTSASCHIPHSRDSIIHTNIKQILASSTQAKRGIARRVNFVHSYTKSSSKGMSRYVIKCSCMIDWFLQKLILCMIGKKIPS